MKIFTAALLISLASVFSMQASAAPAYLIKEFACGGFIPNPDTENGLPPVGDPLFTTQTHGVGAVQDKVGKLTCNFDHDYEGLSSASEARGWICYAFDRAGNLIWTENTLMLATPNGKALKQCKFGPIND